MTKFTIKEGGLADRCSVKPIIWEACNELVQEGHTVSSGFILPVSGTDEVFYAESEDGDVVGVLCRAQHDGQQHRVTLFYVEPSSRRLGVFKALWARAEKDCPRPLVVTVHNKNEAAYLALENGVGLSPITTTYAKG